MTEHPHGSALPPEVNAYLQEQVRAWLAADTKRTAAQLAAQLDMKPPTIANVRNHGRGAGPRFEAGMARVLGIGVDELRRRAHEAWQARKREERTAVEDRYPNRAAALEFLGSELPQPVVERVRAIELRSDMDPTRSWWLERIRSEERLFALEQTDRIETERRAAREDAQGQELSEATRPKRPRRTGKPPRG